MELHSKPGHCQNPACGKRTTHQVSIGSGIRILACKGTCSMLMAPAQADNRQHRILQENERLTLQSERHQAEERAKAAEAEQQVEEYAARYGVTTTRPTQHAPIWDTKHQTGPSDAIIARRCLICGKSNH